MLPSGSGPDLFPLFHIDCDQDNCNRKTSDIGQGSGDKHEQACADKDDAFQKMQLPQKPPLEAGGHDGNANEGADKNGENLRNVALHHHCRIITESKRDHESGEPQLAGLHSRRHGTAFCNSRAGISGQSHRRRDCRKAGEIEDKEMRGQRGKSQLNQRGGQNGSSDDISRCGRQAHAQNDAGQRGKQQGGEKHRMGGLNHHVAENNADAG